MKPTRRWRRGFTLIELVIVILIIGILAAIAYPSYIDSVRKARRAEGKAAITRALQAEERFYTANNVYRAFSPDDPPPTGFTNYSGSSRSTSAYILGAADCGATALQCVTITATAQQNDPLCGTLTLSSDPATPPSSSGTGSSTPTTGCW